MKLKKRFLAIVLVLVLSLALSACNGVTAQDNGGSEPGNSDGGIWDGVNISIDMQTHQASAVAVSGSFDHFVKLMDEMTDGAIKITAYEQNAMYSVPDTFGALSSGELIMASCAEASWYDSIPVSLIAGGLPFIYNSIDQAYVFMMNRGFVEILREAYAEHNIYFIPYEVYSAGIISKKPITDLNSIQGMKLRASGSMSQYLQLVGAAVTNVSGAELYSALQTGIIDGATWGSYMAMTDLNLHEIGKYAIEPDPNIGFWTNVYVNMDFWNSLTHDQQIAFEAAVRLSGSSRISAVSTNNLVGKDNWKSNYGIEITSLTPEASQQFADYGYQLLDTFAEADEYSARAAQLLKDYLAEYDGGKMAYSNQIYFG